MVKTYKRETAWALLAALLVLCGFDLWSGGGSAARYWGELLTTPVFLFAGGAFGLDVVAKQWPRKNGQAGGYS